MTPTNSERTSRTSAPNYQSPSLAPKPKLGAASKASSSRTEGSYKAQAAESQSAESNEVLRKRMEDSSAVDESNLDIFSNESETYIDLSFMGVDRAKQLAAKHLNKELNFWSSKYNDPTDTTFKDKIDRFTQLRDVVMAQIETGKLNDVQIEHKAKELGFALGNAFGLIDDHGKFTPHAEAAFKEAQRNYLASSISTTYAMYLPAATRSALSLLASSLGGPGGTAAWYAVNTAYVAYVAWSMHAAPVWSGSSSSESVSGQTMQPYAQLPDHSSSEVVNEDRNKGELRLPKNVKRDIKVVDRYLSEIEKSKAEPNRFKDLRKLAKLDLSALDQKILDVRGKHGEKFAPGVRTVSSPVRNEKGEHELDSHDELMFKDEELPPPSRKKARLFAAEKELDAADRLSVTKFKDEQKVYVKILKAIDVAEAKIDGLTKGLYDGTIDQETYTAECDKIQVDLGPLRGELMKQKVQAQVWESANVSKAMSEVRAERAGMSIVAQTANFVGAGLEIAGVPGKELASGIGGLLTAITPAVYHYRALDKGWMDYQTKVCSQLTARALTGPGNFHQVWDAELRASKGEDVDPAERAIDPKRLDQMMRGPLKQRMVHFSNTLKFDCQLRALALASKFSTTSLKHAPTIVLNVPALGKVPVEIKLTADRLLATFNKYTKPADRAAYVQALLDGPPGMTEETTAEVLDILAEFETLTLAQSAAAKGDLDTVMDCPLVTQEAKDVLLGSLQHAIGGTPGGKPALRALVTPENIKADATLQRLNGLVERNSRSGNISQCAQKLGQQYAHIFAGSGSPMAIKSLVTVLQIGMKAFGVDPVALEAAAMLGGGVTIVGQLVNIGLGFAYHKYISEKNIQRQRNKDAGIPDMPNAGLLQTSGPLGSDRDFYAFLSTFSLDPQETQGFHTLTTTPVPHVGVDEKVAFQSETSFGADAWVQLSSASLTPKKFFGYFNKPAGEVIKIEDFDAKLQEYEAELAKDRASLMETIDKTLAAHEQSHEIIDMASFDVDPKVDEPENHIVIDIDMLKKQQNAQYVDTDSSSTDYESSTANNNH